MAQRLTTKLSRGAKSSRLYLPLGVSDGVETGSERSHKAGSTSDSKSTG
jgi:hypothetical protein